MPIAAVNEHDGSVPREDEIRTTRQLSVMQCVSQAALVECRSQKHFRAGILLSNGPHNTTARWVNVHS